MKLSNKDKKIFILYIFVLCLICMFLCTFIIKDPDYFWHIKAGEYMIKNKLILKKDVFSWFLYGKKWMSHEWLFEIIINIFKIIFGKIGILIYVFLCLLSLIFIFLLYNKREYLKNIPISLLWIFFMLIFMGFVQARPHLISYNLLAITLYLLYDNYNNEDSKKIYFLPVISLIWANVHGGSSNLSYIITLFFIFSGLFNFKFSKIESKKISWKQIKKYLIVFILSIIAIIVNPHGISMLIYPYLNMMDSTMLSTISEWQPTNFSDIYHIPFLLLIVFTVLIYIFSNKRLKLIDFLLFGFTVVLGLKSVRFWPFVYIVSCFNIFYYIEKRKLDKGTDFVIIIFGVMLLFLTYMNRENALKNFNYKVIGDDIISYLKDIEPKRLYNYYNYGGYLIYNDIDVFVDGRADLYSKYNYKDYYNISTLNGNFVKLIDKYDFDYFVLPKKLGLSTYLKNNDNYEVAIKDKETIVFKKK